MKTIACASVAIRDGRDPQEVRLDPIDLALQGEARPASYLTSRRSGARVLGFARGQRMDIKKKKIATAAVASAALCAWVACGSGSPSAPIATPSPVAAASPSPVPTPTPTPVPQAPPTTTPTPSESPEINDNDAPVERIGAGVYYVECNGEILPNSRNAKEAAVGCRVQLDATPKDADNVPTNPRYKVEWWFSEPTSIEVSGSNPLGPKIAAKRPHKQSINVWVDNVQSNTFSITFY
jgi:hypothetical protein